MSTKTGWGKPKLAGEGFKKTQKPGKGPGNNFIRLLPPMKSLAETGEWSKFIATHWGYKGVASSDASKQVTRPFICIEDIDRRNQMVRQDCPECDKVKKAKDANDAYEATLKAAGKHTDEQLKTVMKERRTWEKSHAADRKVYVNVMLKDGSFCDYKINYKIHKKGIEAKLKELREKNQIEGMDLDQGVWFNLKRIGNGWDPPDVVEVEKESIEVPGVGSAEVIKKAPLTDEQAEQALKECRDLATLGGTVLTYEQIAALAASNGDPNKVDEIFGGRANAAAAATAGIDDDDDETTEAAGPAPASSTPPAPNGAGTATTPPPASADAGADAIKRRAAEIFARKRAEEEAKKAAKKAADEAEAAAAVAVAPAVNPLEMSEEDFLRYFNSTVGASAATT